MQLRDRPHTRITPIKENTSQEPSASGHVFEPQSSVFRIKKSSSPIGMPLQSSSHFKVSENSMNSIYQRIQNLRQNLHIGEPLSKPAPTL